MTKPAFYTTKPHPKTLIIGVEAPYNRTLNIDAYFDEFVSLIETSKTPYDAELYLKLRTIDPTYFFTKGKLVDLKKFVEENQIRHIVISEQLTPTQERNLSSYLYCSITDRTRLILEIFEKAAHSAEGQAQVAIAKMRFEKTRLAGKGVGLAQQKGSIGVRGGFGETLKERESRHIEETINKLKKQLETLQKNRDTQRKQRLSKRIPHICLIGYTNAGKSTILNALTKSDVLAEDKLFATLDTTTRKLFINGKEKGLLSDTVGFIQQLPPHLIDAFKSTLSELEHADLLLHVIDISAPDWESHIKVVYEILDDLGVDKPMLHVFNKCDKIHNIEALQTKLEKYQPYVMVDALSKEGLTLLIEFLDEWEPSIQIPTNKKLAGFI
ncbi:MAG TPA: GTPase HflX [Candidatus Dependentiae bacterium]|nr:GTPase HflX [Candidatus Dependentiae bacterium]HRQ62275.1 GTPase HflX [Candidatus Dependentiae bacterium]